MESKLKKSHLRVLEGGGHKPEQNYRFISAYVTDTRLMGVVVLYIHWRADLAEASDFHQFFYYDAEEYGLETYKSLVGNDEAEIDLLEQTLIGGLGGTKQSVNEREARHLVKYFHEASALLHAPPAEPVSEYQFMLDQPVKLTDREQRLLTGKICAPIPGDYPLIHYFLMRCYAHDPVAANYLAINDDLCSRIAPAQAATLYRNSIDEFDDPKTGSSYLCEALIEQDSRYSIEVLDIRIEAGLIADAQRRSSFRISPAEAAMQLNRPEYITVYDILAEPDQFDEAFLPLTRNAMLTVHDNGRLFLEFQNTNEHVNHKVFRLNDDIMGLYYITDYGQLLLTSYSLAEIQMMEHSLLRLPLRQYLVPGSKYEFKEPVLYEFIQSDFEDFADFLDTLQRS
ncbi:MAG TPA: hypothetical protein GX726_04600 [Clostridiales bacterium]|jgi:hypothetical protein|nr:hypothetical protein [Clostridiales bacterium]